MRIAGLSFGIVSLLLVIALVSFLGVKEIGSLSNSNNPKVNVERAQSVKDKADLLNLETKLNAFFIEKSRYPNSLSELNDSSLENFVYTFCSDTSVKIEKNKEVVLLRSGQTSSLTDC